MINEYSVLYVFSENNLILFKRFGICVMKLDQTYRSFLILHIVTGYFSGSGRVIRLIGLRLGLCVCSNFRKK